MAPDDSVRFAIIGAGLIGPRHAKTVFQSKAATLVAIVDPSPSGRILAEELVVAYYESIADLMTSPDRPDAAVICTPNHTHVPIAIEVSSHGIHVLIEKPLGVDIAEGEELIKHIKPTKVKAIVGHHRRFNPYITTTRQILDDGVLGKIIAINGLWMTYKPADYFQAPAEWRTTKAGGVVLINMIHEVDILHHLFGSITRVHAEKTEPHRGHEAEEGAALTFRFKSGIIGTFLLSDAAPSPYNFESGTGENIMFPHTGQDFLRIFGSDGSLSVPDMTLWSYGTKPKSWTSELMRENIDVSPSLPFEAQLDHFVRVIREEEEPSCTVQAGQAALIVCQAIKDALESNGTVELPAYDLR
ncbi:hypothetical protein B9Z65_3835 [Elsinoe australis]|uniref:Uncharacterized protein n=1 Tax=Elsinoe australis TaxID=40998 RepID=A0A2P8A2R3_9PEZI|nr:hypothetical protein B9Z65_3835 [Elsinoe australis]